MKKLLMLVCLLSMGGAVAGCSNTMEGAGRDIEKAGEKVQDTF